MSSVLDTLKLNRIIVDDAQVVDLLARKRYADYQAVGAVVRIAHVPLIEEVS